MLVRGRWRTPTVLISTPMTPRVALSLTAAVKSEPHVRAASSLQSVRRLPEEEVQPRKQHWRCDLECGMLAGDYA